jgi:hypothetical protein
MTIQQDPSKSFGSSSYFKNKDQQRQQVNAMRQSERQKRITTQLLRRNMKQAMRRGEDGGRFIQAAEAADLDIFGRTGLGEEASVAMERARYDADQNFNAASRAKAQKDARLGASNTKPGEKTNPADGKTTGIVDGKVRSSVGAMATPESMVTRVDSKLSREEQIKSLRPDWADEVKSDRTFKDLNFEDPTTLELIQGKSRGEVYDMLRKQQAAKLMAGFDERGKTNALAEQAILDERKKTAEKEARIKKGFEDFSKEQAFAKTPTGIFNDVLKKAEDDRMTAYVENVYGKTPELEQWEKNVKTPSYAPNAAFALAQNKSDLKYNETIAKIDKDFESYKNERAAVRGKITESYEKFDSIINDRRSSPETKRIEQEFQAYQYPPKTQK